MYEEISKIPLKNGTIVYHETAKIISMRASKSLRGDKKDTMDGEKSGTIAVVTAGTTDIPVAEEAAVTLEESNCVVERVYDAGAAGLHRVINALPILRRDDVDCVIVCAGMDGVLPTIVAGLISVPVVAVPTSVGYGANFGGLAPLMTALNGCAPGVGVVNINNGFGAAALAYKFVRRVANVSRRSLSN